jgi:hypothetical protein
LQRFNRLDDTGGLDGLAVQKQITLSITIKAPIAIINPKAMAIKASPMPEVTFAVLLASTLSRLRFENDRSALFKKPWR